MLPLLTGDLIPVVNDHWENFLRLLKIEEIVFVPQTSIQLAAYLAVLIEGNSKNFMRDNTFQNTTTWSSTQHTLPGTCRTTTFICTKV